jgi:hypothetical protein
VPNEKRVAIGIEKKEGFAGSSVVAPHFGASVLAHERRGAEDDLELRRSQPREIGRLAWRRRGEKSNTWQLGLGRLGFSRGGAGCEQTAKRDRQKRTNDEPAQPGENHSPIHPNFF